MFNSAKVMAMANAASFFEDGSNLFRIIYCNDEDGYFWCTDEKGCEYSIGYNEVDLDTDKFYKSVVMDPKDY